LIIHIDEDYEAGAVLVFLPVSLWEPSMYVISKVNSDCMVYCIQLQTTTFNGGYQMRNGFVLDRVSEYFQSSDSKSCLVLKRIRCTVCMYRWSVGYISAHSMCVVCLLFCGLGEWSRAWQRYSWWRTDCLPQEGSVGQHQNGFSLSTLLWPPQTSAVFFRDLLVAITRWVSP
jgi:hypothetical protein